VFLSALFSTHIVHLSPNFIMLTFIETSPLGKSWTQITEVADTDHFDMS